MTQLQKILIAGEWREAKNPVARFQAANPANKSLLPEFYPVSGATEVDELLAAGQKAAEELRSTPPGEIAGMLEKYADKIEQCADDLVDIAHQETALPKEPRLRNVELPRTTDQLRKAAASARALDWCKATIDTATNIRSMFGPLGGPVVIFGPNNFPFAFNAIAGGDFAAAIAAGNPVIAKANPGHPGTTRLLAQAALEAVKETGLPGATVQLVYHLPPELGLKLVSHPDVGASAFTGSRAAGLKLKQAADNAGKPIYLEMSSINPVFILPGALTERPEEIAAELFGACTLGAGQFCTNPGLVFLQHGQETESFIRVLANTFAGSKPGVLLSAQGPENIQRAVTLWKSAGAQVVAGGEKFDAEGYAFANTLLRVDGRTFLKNPADLQTEAFGAASLLVVTENLDQMQQAVSALEGNLTGSIYSSRSGADDETYRFIEPGLRSKVGRLLNDKMPTGVAVVSAMNHGGPYPATGHPGFTAVGLPAAMLRFAALHCYDNVRPHRLPVELQDKNPTGTLWRLIDGQWTQKSL